MIEVLGLSRVKRMLKVFMNFSFEGSFRKQCQTLENLFGTHSPND